MPETEIRRVICKSNNLSCEKCGGKPMIINNGDHIFWPSCSVQDRDCKMVGRVYERPLIKVDLRVVEGVEVTTMNGIGV